MQASRTLKVVLIGDGDAGKTSLRQRYLTDRFQHAYRATIGADFVSKTIEVSVPIPQSTKAPSKDHSKIDPTSADSGLASASVSTQTETVRVTVSIWDTAGQERFRSLGTAFYRGADAVVIAFDVTKRGALERTLSWYKDFCSFGDLGMDDDENEQGKTPKQLRVARERRERFCWVAVGCKADLLLHHEPKVESSFRPTSSSEARSWFNGILPRYLPEGHTEQDLDDPNAVEPTQVRPYTINGEAPALPEDVLSRPSPKNYHASLLPHTSNESNQSRHPDAGTPPGEALRPGSGGLLRRQSSTQHLARQTAVLPIDNSRKSPARQPYEHSHPSRSSSSMAPSTVRSRYDSAVSTSGQSVYYSLRGSTTYSQSPAARSQSTDTTERDAKSRSSTKSEATEASDDEVDTVHEANDRREERDDRRPTLRKVFSTESDATATAAVKNEELNGRAGKQPYETEETDTDEEEIRPRRVAPAVPSGEPIPFPTEEDDHPSSDLSYVGRSVRHSRISTRRHSRHGSRSQSKGDNQVSKQTSAEIIAEQVKSDRELQADESVVDKRATLYSARPSSCNSTIRPADADLGQDITHETQQDHDEDAAAQANDIRDACQLYEDQIEHGFRLFYTSAKSGASVDDVFEHIARRVAIRWALEEWEESQRREMWGYDPQGEVRTAPPIDEEMERERMRRAIKISQGKSVGGCCS